MRTDCDEFLPHDYACSPDLIGQPAIELLPDPIDPFFWWQSLQQEIRDENKRLAKNIQARISRQKRLEKALKRKLQRQRTASALRKHRRFLVVFLGFVGAIQRRFAIWRRVAFKSKSEVEIVQCHAAKIIAVSDKVAERIKDKLCRRGYLHPRRINPSWFLWGGKWIIRFFFSESLTGYRLCAVSQVRDRALLREFEPERWMVSPGKFAEVQNCWS